VVLAKHTETLGRHCGVEGYWSLIEGLALTAAAEHSKLLLPLRNYWSQDDAAERRARTRKTGFAGWHGWITFVISMEPV